MDLDELEIKENSKLKFFIKKENDEYYYYAYYYTESADGNIDLIKSENMKHNLKIAKVGDIIINYFNIDFFDAIYNYSIYIKNQQFELAYKEKLKLQNNVGILASHLLIKYFHDTFTYLVGFPEIYYNYANDLLNKVNVPNAPTNFKYVLDAFTQKDTNYVYMNNEACIQYLSDIRDILKLGYTNIKNSNQTNLLNLTQHPNTSQITYEILPDINTNQPLEVYSINDIITFVLFDIVQVTKNKIQINKCQNCGKYFFPISKENEKYCNNLFEKTGKSCRDSSYEIKLNTDKLTKIYRNAYKNQNARKQYYIQHIPNVDKELANKKFQNWVNNIINEKIKCENGDISIEEFEIWVKNNNIIQFY